MNAHAYAFFGFSYVYNHMQEKLPAMKIVVDEKLILKFIYIATYVA